MVTMITMGGLIILLYMVLLWLVSLLLKNSSIIDIFWGLGFVIVSWFYYSQSGFPLRGRSFLINLLVTIWGLRLSIYILWRNWGKPEDFRYQKWRNEAGKSWWWKSFFKVFLLQGLLMWFISMPLFAAHLQNTTMNWLDMVGTLIWGIGFLFESVGDLQLARFKADPANRGKVLDYGVWKYTRHPNYFGDAAQWWGYFLIALAAGGWWTIFSPVIMTYLLLKISGVKLLEVTLQDTKPAYREYIKKTSAFFPLPPRRKE
ncbi:MAG TPA: hypothetical protein DCK95_05445 [Anaerolineaceae bacterium]|nr:hypothetical protein [Anaerolineaceae bacterium]